MFWATIVGYYSCLVLNESVDVLFQMKFEDRSDSFFVS